MKHPNRFIFPLLLLVSLPLYACQNGISPAESELLGCEAYDSALATLTPLKVKMSAGTVSIVDHVRETLNPLCLGPAPDVDATIKDIAVDAGVKTLQSIIAKVF